MFLELGFKTKFNQGHKDPWFQAWMEHKGKESWICSLPDCLSWNSNHLLPLVLLVLRPLDLDWNLHYQLLALRTSSYIASFPGSLACRRQIMRLLSLHNHMSQYLIAKLSLSMYTCIMFVCVCVCVCDRFSINIMSFNVVLLCYRTENRVEQVSQGPLKFRRCVPVGEEEEEGKGASMLLGGRVCTGTFFSVFVF